MESEFTIRERQILDVLYQLGNATANEVVEAIPVELANATVRTLLRILEEKGANEVMVQIAYAIGYRHPVSCVAWIDGIAENQDILRDDLTPQGIITSLDLCRPIYEQTARYGHFGRGYTWG